MLAGPADRNGCPDTSKQLPVLKRDRIPFVTGKSVLTPASYRILDDMIAQVSADTTTYILVDGYADNTGKRSVNKVISAHRALTVKRYLIRKGIPASHIIARGHGSNDPIASNRTASGRAQNRRVKLRIEQH